MRTNLPWDDLQLFAAVARAGSLTRAADATGISIATLSRRMKTFEARSGRRLFLHGGQGYALSGDGRALLERAARMEAAAQEIDQWQNGQTGPTPVRISAGTWTALFLADHLTEYWSPDATWLPEFVHCNVDMDIARREIDIGIRNRRPSHPWLAGQRTTHVEFAAYGTPDAPSGWIGPSRDAALLPSGRWLEATHGAEIVTRSNEPRLALAMARAGVGRVVLPMFVGEHDPVLTRLSDPIGELRSEEWLVAHHDARHDPPIRAALNALAGFLRQPLRPAASS